MNRQQLIAGIAALLDKYETENNNESIGCEVAFSEGNRETYSWNGDQLNKIRGFVPIDQVEAVSQQI